MTEVRPDLVRTRSSRKASSEDRPISSRQKIPEEITGTFFAAAASNAWFRSKGHECTARMPTTLLDRPLHDVFATTMPPGRPGQNEPGGDESETGDDTEEDDEEEEEANPS
jgi:hypothetical protein